MGRERQEEERSLSILVGAFFGSTHCRRIAQGAVEHVRQRGGHSGREVRVELISDYLRFLRLAGHVRWDGAVIYANYYQVAYGMPQRQHPAFASFGIPFVDTSNRYADASWPKVTQDDVAIGRRAARTLASKGVTDASWIGFSNHVAYSEERQIGFLETLREFGITFHAGLDITPDPSFDEWSGREKRIAVWMQSLPPHTGIFACNDELAASLLRVLLGMRIRVPRDFLLLGADNDPELSHSQGIGISSIDVGSEAVGRLAVQRLLEHLEQGRPLPEHDKVDQTEFIERDSTMAELGDAPAWLRRMLALMRETPHIVPDIQSLSTRQGLNRRTLEREFQRWVGQSPLEYLQNCRMEKARRLLRDTRWRVSRIAGECGYTDEKWFLTQFKRRNGMTPSQYRQSG